MKQADVRYDVVLLDADNTLFDFNRAERWAFYQTLEQCGCQADEELYAWYSAINDSYWKQLEKGEVTREQVVELRFVPLVEKLGLNATPQKINQRFQASLREAAYLLDGALELCETLHRHCTLAIATNGVARTQRRRLEKSALHPLISHVVISEEVGAEKPSALFFEKALWLCGSPPKNRVLMVGDSLSADMKGGVDFGLDTCWYNPQKLANHLQLPVTYTISSLMQLPAIVMEQDPKLQRSGG